MGGDELNIIEAGRNYGWPVVSYGLDYNHQQAGRTVRHHLRASLGAGHGGAVRVLDALTCAGRHHLLYWRQVPDVEGERVHRRARPRESGQPAAAPRRVQPTRGAIQRNGRRTLMAELKQRIRTIRQGPDGLLYLATDEPRRRGAADRAGRTAIVNRTEAWRRIHPTGLSRRLAMQCLIPASFARGRNVGNRRGARRRGRSGAGARG